MNSKVKVKVEYLEKNVIKPKGKIPFSDFDELSKELLEESVKMDFVETLTIAGMVKRLRWDRKKTSGTCRYANCCI